MFGLIIGAATAIAATVAGALSAALGTISTTLGALSITLLGVEKVVDIIISIGKKLGLIKADENVPIIGDQFLQSEEAGITLDKFENWDEYKKAVENFEIDEARSKEIKDEEKVIAGLAFMLKDIENAMNFEVGELLEVLKDMPEFLDESKVFELIEKLKEEKISVENFKGYFEGKSNIDESMKIEKILDEIKEK